MRKIDVVLPFTFHRAVLFFESGNAEDLAQQIERAALHRDEAVECAIDAARRG